MTNYCRVSEPLAWKGSNAVAEDTLLIVHHTSLGHGFMRLYQLTDLHLLVTPSRGGNPLCLTLLLPKGIYTKPHQES